MPESTEKHLHVEGMTCGGCEASIVRVLSALPGVQSVRADHVTGMVVLEIDPDAPPAEDALTAAITRAGFARVA